MFSMSYNVRIMRSLRNEVEQIWENAELRHFPHNPCYVSRPKRSVGRAQRGTERSGVSSKNIFRSYSL